MLPAKKRFKSENGGIESEQEELDKTYEEDSEENRQIRARNHQLIDEFFSRTAKMIESNLSELSRLVEKSLFNAVHTYTRTVVKEMSHFKCHHPQLVDMAGSDDIKKETIKENEPSDEKTSEESDSDIEIIEVKHGEVQTNPTVETQTVEEPQPGPDSKIQPEEIPQQNMAINSVTNSEQPDVKPKMVIAVKRKGYVRSRSKSRTPPRYIVSDEEIEPYLEVEEAPVKSQSSPAIISSTKEEKKLESNREKSPTVSKITSARSSTSDKENYSSRKRDTEKQSDSDRSRHKRPRSRERSDRRKFPSKSRDNEPNSCLAVFGLSRSLTERSLIEFFNKFGPLKWVRILHGFKRNYGFVNFANVEDAQKVLDKHKQSVCIDGCDGIQVKWSLRNPYEPALKLESKRLTKPG